LTTLFDQSISCSVCGKESQHKGVGSTSSFGSTDLDTRPPQMQRSTMSFWVQECPHCGYVNGSLEKPINLDKDYLETSEYKDFHGEPPVSALAQRFIRKARISIKKESYVEAFWDYLHAAWASDDKKDQAWQIELRKLALQAMEKFGDDIMKDSYRVIRADLLRRSHQFERVVQEYENVRFKDDLLNKIVQFEILKAKNKDAETYTVKNVTG